MSQAEELLNSLSTDEMAAYSVKSTVEPHIIIGADRFIKVPTSLQRIAVEHDHNVETVTFECPRYWDEHDLSKMAIYINYILSNGYADGYPVSNVTVEGDIMLFTWTISRNVAQVNGGIKFLVCAKKTDSDGNEVNHWNSELCEDMYVSKGMENTPQIAAEYPDLITELLLRVKSVQDINIQADEMQTILDETKAVAKAAEDAKDVATDESNYIKNNYANSIKGTASGSVIRVDDVSPVEHSVKCSVHGKNLVNVADVTVENFTGYHTPTPLGFEVEVGKTYTVSMDVESSVEPFILSVGLGNSAAYIADIAYNRELSNGRVSATFTPSAEQVINGKFVHIRAPRYAYETTYSATISNIQLEEGSDATEYEPYIDPTSVTVRSSGKNVFNKALSTVDFSAASGWCRGILNSDCTKRTFHPNTTYTIRFTAKCVEDVSYDNFFSSDIGFGILNQDTQGLVVMKLYGGTDETKWLKKGQSITCVGTFTTPSALYDSDNYTTVMYTQRALLEDGTVVCNKLNFVELHIELGDTVDVCEDYVGAEYMPATDGTVDVVSISPTTTIYTDTAGVTIEAEYNRDTNKQYTILDTDEPDIEATYSPNTIYSANTINKLMMVIGEMFEEFT